MTLPLRPNRGGYQRPTSCGIFIRDFLLGLNPEYEWYRPQLTLYPELNAAYTLQMRINSESNEVNTV